MRRYLLAYRVQWLTEGGAANEAVGNQVVGNQVEELGQPSILPTLLDISNWRANIENEHPEGAKVVITNIMPIDDVN